MLSHEIDGTTVFFVIFAIVSQRAGKRRNHWNLELIFISLGYAHLKEWKQYLLIEWDLIVCRGDGLLHKLLLTILLLALEE